LNVAMLAWLGLVLLCTIFLASPGAGDAFFAAGTVVERTLTAGLLACVWCAGAIGLGILASPLWRGVESVVARRALCTGSGIALGLWLAHLMGVLGLLGRWVSWIPTIAGLLLLLGAARSSGTFRAKARVSWLGLVTAPAIAVLIVAASNPPGGLWASEAGGYDVLSYHLQGPKEWLGAGHILPLDHNVYTYLPAYVEAAYTQLGAMLGVGSDPSLGAGSGDAVYAAQFLHMMFAVLAAWMIGCFVRTAMRERDDDPRSNVVGILTLALCLGVPWLVVTGSMAYNEMGVLLSFACALLAARADGITPMARGALVGALIGVACSAKPTALFMAAPGAGVALLAFLPLRRWPVAIGAGVVAGLCALAPWLVRNVVASGNPVFPELTGVFGLGHWTSEQAARWAAGHHLDLTFGARLGRLFDPSFGVVHPQWSIFFGVVLVAAITTLILPRTRRAGAVLSITLVLQVIAWLLIGHLQSRFLVPAIVPGGALIGIALHAAPIGPVFRSAAALVGAIALFMSGHTIWLFLGEAGGRPNLLLLPGVAGLNGDQLRGSAIDLADTHSVIAVNLGLPEDAVVYLLGDATGLYFDRLPPRLIMHSTWDTSPLGTRLRDADGDLDAAMDALRRDLGVTHVLINPAELARLHDSGWYDPDVTIVEAEALVRRYGYIHVEPGGVRVLIAMDRTDESQP
jgi:hypothetical protein